MNLQSHRAWVDTLRPGDSFVWCDRVVTLYRIELARSYIRNYRRVGSRRLHVMFGFRTPSDVMSFRGSVEGRHLNRKTIRLHYFDDEAVEIADATPDQVAA